MTVVNIVATSYNLGSENTYKVQSFESEGYQFIWSEKILDKSDVVVFCNIHSYFKSQWFRSKHLKGKLKILKICDEPPVVEPEQHLKFFWNRFDIIITWTEHLLKASPKFVPISMPSCFGGPNRLKNKYDKEQYSDFKAVKKEKKICMINSYKKCLVYGELYSERFKIAKWFEDVKDLPLHVYGNIPSPLRNYKGKLADKFSMLSRYLFSIAFENFYDPKWSKGYVTEKVFDALFCYSIPIVYNNQTIESIIPSNCYVDYSSFSSISDFYTYLKNLSDEEIDNYLKNIHRFNQSFDYHTFYSIDMVHKNIIEAIEKYDKQNTPKKVNINDFYDDLPSVRAKSLFILYTIYVSFRRFWGRFLFLRRSHKYLYNKILLLLGSSKRFIRYGNFNQ